MSTIKMPRRHPSEKVAITNNDHHWHDCFLLTARFIRCITIQVVDSVPFEYSMASNHPAPHKSILFTNLYISARTGSELHILELSKAFSSAGWDVTCFALVIAHPFLEEFANSGVKLVELGHESELSDSYTVLYAQHHLTADFIWTNTDISFDKIVVSSLGPQSEHEKLPLLSNNADLFVYVSEETRRANRPSSSSAPCIIFPNCVSSDFFETNMGTHRRTESLPRRIAVISNHVVPELRQLANHLDCNSSISFYGLEDRSVEVTPAFLQSFDLVITIGRTVVACFATHTPVYIYDVFGGDGYLNPGTLEQSAQFNFSGRPGCKHRTSSELWEDIASHYGEACLNLEALYTYAKRDRSFETVFERLLFEIESITPRAHSSRNFDSIIRVKQHLLAESFALQYGLTLGRAQLFYPGVDGALSEKNSVSFRFAYGAEISIHLDHPSNKFVRFDPDDCPVRCLTRPRLTPLNSFKSDERGDVFLTNDPMYAIPETLTYLEFTCYKIDIQKEVADSDTQTRRPSLSHRIHALPLRVARRLRRLLTAK